MKFQIFIEVFLKNALTIRIKTPKCHHSSPFGSTCITKIISTVYIQNRDKPAPLNPNSLLAISATNPSHVPK